MYEKDPLTFKSEMFFVKKNSLKKKKAAYKGGGGTCNGMGWANGLLLNCPIFRKFAFCRDWNIKCFSFYLMCGWVVKFLFCPSVIQEPAWQWSGFPGGDNLRAVPHGDVPLPPPNPGNDRRGKAGNEKRETALWVCFSYVFLLQTTHELLQPVSCGMAGEGMRPGYCYKQKGTVCCLIPASDFRLLCVYFCFLLSLIGLISVQEFGLFYLEVLLDDFSAFANTSHKRKILI